MKKTGMKKRRDVLKMKGEQCREEEGEGRKRGSYKEETRWKGDK